MYFLYLIFIKHTYWVCNSFTLDMYNSTVCPSANGPPNQVDSRPQFAGEMEKVWRYFEFLSKRSAEVRCDDSLDYND